MAKKTDQGDKGLAVIPKMYTERFLSEQKAASKGVLSMAETAADVRDKFGHSSYVSWCVNALKLSESTANRILRVYTNLLDGRERKDLESISPTALYLLADPKTPTKIREDAIDAAKGGNAPKPEEIRKATKEVMEKKGKATPPPPEPKVEKVDVKKVESPARQEPFESDVPADAGSLKIPTLKAFAEDVGGIVLAMEVCVRKMETTFDAKSKTLNHPYASRYTHAGTIAATRDIIRILNDYKPVSEDDKGFVVAIDLRRKRN